MLQSVTQCSPCGCCVGCGVVGDVHGCCHAPVLQACGTLPPKRLLLRSVFFRWTSPQSHSTGLEILQSSRTSVSESADFAKISIDHGKTTLCNRMLRLTGTEQGRDERIVLDNLRVEQERGITVKAHTTSMFYTYSDGHVYLVTPLSA